MFKKTVTSEQILGALKGVIEPDSAQDIVRLNMVSGIQVSEDNHVVFLIEVTPERGGAMEPLRQHAEKVVSKIRGVKKVQAILTAERSAGDAQNTYTSSSQRAGSAQEKRAPHDPHGMEKNPRLKIPVKNIIVVASGKGGVGKSSISNTLAHNLAKNSHFKVGILDADIYGPSQPILTGLLGAGKPETNDKGNIIPPIVQVDGNAYGLKVMSIGFMIDTGKALVWRGPMVQSAIYQLFRDVQWAEEGDMLDILIVDMPPGTGDAQLTLAQKIDVDGAIIVSTPQDLALADARRGLEMFNATNVPILGLIENMSTHVCSNCGHEEHIFGHGGAAREAEKLGVPYLGEVPLSMAIREACDAGRSFDLPEEIVSLILGKLAL